jgi:alpha-mannosidase
MSKGTIHLIGNAHLDPTWLWRWQIGCGEVLQTFRSALDRLNEYPKFIFTCSSAAYYRWVEEIAPDMFEEIKQRVKQGRWVPVNGWWVQPDCNMPSGESFARQALYSQLYYYEKFGITCKTGYNVDSFGHNGMLPQLLKKGGMDFYVMMRPHPHENPDIPKGAFWWDSPDGSRVLTFRIPTGYAEHGQRNIDRGIEALEEIMDKNGYPTMLFYGVGNHGGGPTRGDIEYLKSISDREGRAELEFSNTDDYFNDMLHKPLDLPVWKDDMQHHASGCYSATSLVKQLNRKAENLLGAAEKWSTVANKIAGMPAQNDEFSEAWRSVCYNQFHDVLCGCSIMEAYEDARIQYDAAMDRGSKAMNHAQLRLARQIDTWLEGVSDPVYCEVRNKGAERRFPRPVIIFNPHSWDIETPIRVLECSEWVKDSQGNNIHFQNIRSSRSNDTHLDTLFVAKVPAMGYSTYWLKYPEDNFSIYNIPEFKDSAIKTDEDNKTITIENEFVRVEFDKATGTISELIDLKTKYNYANKGHMAVPTVIDDHVTDTWAHNVFKFHDVKGKMSLVSVELVESGPVRALVRTKHRFNDSYLTQEFILAEGQKTIRVKCKAIWQEEFTMLKMAFPTEGREEISTYEIPCGFIKRPCNGEEEPALQWADLTVTDDKGIRRGFSVMSDSKYSYDCPGTELRLTCIRNVIFADHYSSRPPALFNFTDEGLQRFEYGIYLHEGEAENSDIVKEAALFNCRPTFVPESYHKGTAPQVKSFINIDADNVIVTALKLCEDGSGDTIIRLYETKGKNVKAVISLDLIGVSFFSDFKKHEIKTFRISQDGKVSEVNFLEGIVD